MPITGRARTRRTRNSLLGSGWKRPAQCWRAMVRGRGSPIDIRDKRSAARYIGMVMTGTQCRCFIQLASTASIWQCIEAGAIRCLQLVGLLLVSVVPVTLVARAPTPAKSLLAPLISPAPPQQPVPPPPAPASPVNQAIPLPEIADRAEQLESLLREISDQLTPPADLAE